MNIIRDHVLRALWGTEEIKNGVLYIPDGVTAVAAKACRRLSGFKTIVFPQSCTIIADEAFAESADLTELTIPKTITDIGTFAFAACHKLTNMKFTKDDLAFGTKIFSQDENLKYFTDAAGKTVRLFYVPRNDIFGMGEKKHATEKGVEIYKGVYISDFPHFQKALNDGLRWQYFAVSKNENGEEKIWSSDNEEDAIAGVYLQTHHQSLHDLYGDLTEQLALSAQDVGLICGTCDAGVAHWAKMRHTTPYTKYPVVTALAMLREDLPGIYRRLVYALQHWNDDTTTLPLWDEKNHIFATEAKSGDFSGLQTRAFEIK